MTAHTPNITAATEPCLNTRDFAIKHNVTPRLLRYYHGLDLLRPERRGRDRYFSPLDAKRLASIKRAADLGLELSEIFAYLDHDTGRVEIPARIVHRQLDALVAKRDLVQEQIIAAKEMVAQGKPVVVIDGSAR